MALVCRRLVVAPGVAVNLFDPCAGEGRALRQMAEVLAGKGARVTTYGVELERFRAEKARKLLDHVIAGGYETIRMTNGAVSAMWLNPPYADMKGSGRVETMFLRDLTRERLQPGGLLMFCIPQSTLSDCASVLANRFKDIEVYRFTDEHYPLFRQVVVFGYRREKNDSGPEARQVSKRLAYLGRQGLEAIKPLDVQDGRTFAVPPAVKEISLFRGSEVARDEAAGAVARSTVFAKMEELLMPPPVARVKMSTPILPLKLAHIGTAIAAGAVGGNMGNHIVVGNTKKVVKTFDCDEKTIMQTEQMVTTIKVFSPQGIFVLE
jgi:hypothetical protein